MYYALIGFPGPMELMIIMGIILVIFGGAKLPEMARNIGRGMRVFKEEANSLRKEIEISDQPATATSSASKASDSGVKDVTPEAKADKDKTDLEKMSE